MQLTGFADEIAKDLDEQIALLQTLGIRHVEFRSAWGANVLDLSEEQLNLANQKLDAAGITLSSVGSDLGKLFITDPFDAHLERARHGVEVANFCGAKYIRMFSFFIPEGENPDQYREEVMRRTRAMVELAEAGGITLLHENEKDIYGDAPERVGDLMTTIDSPNYRAIIDPANFVQCGFKPADEAWAIVGKYIEYVHVKDYRVAALPQEAIKLFEAGEFQKGYDLFVNIIHFVEVGQGNMNWPKLLPAAEAAGAEYFFIEQDMTYGKAPFACIRDSREYLKSIGY